MLKTFQPCGLALLALAALSSGQRAHAQALTKTLVVDNVGGAAFVTTPPGDFDRLFIMRLNGRIEIFKNGALNSAPFINLGAGGLAKITTGGERGLLGLAFHPNYAQNGFFYVNYTNLQGNTVVERYQVSGNSDLADTNSGTMVIGPITQPQSNHNGGCLQFGPDGKLYIAMGDGGNANDTGPGHDPAVGNAQLGTTLLGKILRLDVDLPFPHIPGDNPFVGNPNVNDEIWHMGVRNPWRMSFDRATGELYIGDVGQGAREEVDIQPAGMGGLNYGWRCMEGFNCTGLTGCTCNAANLSLPVHDYSHAQGRCSITGGYVYRGCAMPGEVGNYFFADFCSRQVYTFSWNGTSIQNLQERTAEITNTGGTLNSIASFGEDAAGELYLCDNSGGRVYKIVPVAFSDCNANSVADSCDIANGGSQDADNNGIPDECNCSPAPFTYCTAKSNSQFCAPTMSFLGTPKVGNPFPFLVQATDELNNLNGILFYGFGANANPFQGGFMCAQAPIKRTGLQNAHGNPGLGTDCSGSYSFDFNAHIASGVDPALVAGQQVNAEYWSRDPQDFAGFGTNLSNALQFVICN